LNHGGPVYVIEWVHSFAYCLQEKQDQSSGAVAEVWCTNRSYHRVGPHTSSCLLFYGYVHFRV